MKRFSLWPALLAVVVFLAALPARAAVPLKDVTEDKLRTWTDKALKASRDDPAKADFWKELDALIVVNPDKIIYEQEKGVPVRVFWECKPKRNLDGAERNKALKMLRKFYDYATLEHDKGFLSAADAKLLDVVTHLDVGPNPGNPRKRPATVPTTPVKEVTQDTVQDWVAIAIEATRKDPAWAEIWKEMDDLLVVDPDGILYEHDKGVPVKLTWQVVPRRALTAEERLKVQADLQKLFQYILFEYNKGLVPAADVEVLKTVVHAEVGGEIGTQPKVADNSADIEKLRKDLADVRSDIEKMRKDHADDQAEIDKFRKERADSQTEIDKFRKERADLQAQVDVLVKKASEKGPDFQADIEKSRKERADLQAQIDVLLKKETDFRANFDQLKKDQGDSRAAIEQLRKDVVAFRGEIDEVRKELVKVEIDVKAQLASRSPATPSNPRYPANSANGAPSGYIMVVQPSSMIYYDCYSHCWLPGPAYVMFYPAGAAEAPRASAFMPRAPAFMPPAPAPLPPPEVHPKGPEKVPEQSRNPEEADRVFWVGYRSYWQGDYDRALASFASAVRLDGQDARFWYYKALAERALGDAVKAEESAHRGRELHSAQKPKADLVSAALERVQGQERRFLNAPEVLVSDAKDDR